MQDLLTFAIDSIALTAAAYFLIGLCLHLHCCWEHPPVKAAPIAAESPVLLLPPAAELHPFEMSLEKMPAIEPIAALHQPAAAVEMETEEAIELPPVEVAPHVEPDAPIGYQAMSSQQLRTLCTQHGIQWRSVKAGKHLTKPQMIAALTV